MDLADVLSGQAGLDGVRSVLLGRPIRRILRQELHTLLGPDDRIRCRLRRAKFKPGRKLTAYYDVALGTAGATARPIAVTWTHRPDPVLFDDDPGLLALEAQALMEGVAAPFRRLHAERPAVGMRLLVFPLDPSYPHLALLSDPRRIPALLATASGTSAAADVLVPSVRYSVGVIRYRPGQRHVLRYDSFEEEHGGNGDGLRRTVFAKLYRRGAGEGSELLGAGGGRPAIVDRVADWLSSAGDDVRALRPLGHVADHGVVLYPRVPGAPLWWFLRARGGGLERHLQRAGVALRRLQAFPAPLPELPVHSLQQEIEAIGRASEALRPLLPTAHASVQHILADAYMLHERMPREPPAFAHGDYKADHLWVTSRGMTVIDFDSCRLADPALDLGKFLADVQWWLDGAGGSTLEVARERFLRAYDPDVPRERLWRARLYEALVLAKITVRRVRLFDRNWEARTRELVGRAEALLSELRAEASRASPVRR
jgi:hypothetical protein